MVGWCKETIVPWFIMYLSKELSAPMKEEYLMIGPLESTNCPYALAKIAGIETCWAYNRQYGTRYLAVMPTTFLGLTIVMI